MRKWIIVVICACILPSLGFAECDLKTFRWECDMPVNINQHGKTKSLIYCDNINIYVTQKEYDQIAKYKRSMIDTNLTINGEFFSGPCIPVQRE